MSLDFLSQPVEKRSPPQALLRVAFAVLILLACVGEPVDAKTQARSSIGEINSLSSSRAEQLRFGTEVARCMKRQGFEYVPAVVLNPAYERFRRNDGTIDGEAFFREFGWGIFTLSAPGIQPNPGPDANLRNLQAMSTSEQVEYRRALGGDNRTYGCLETIARAQSQDNVMRTVNEQYDVYETRIETDKRVLRAYRDWSTCMARSGFRFRRPVDVPKFLSAKLIDSGLLLGSSAAKLEMELAHQHIHCAKHLKARTDLLRLRETQLLEQYGAEIAALPSLQEYRTDK